LAAEGAAAEAEVDDWADECGEDVVEGERAVGVAGFEFFEEVDADGVDGFEAALEGGGDETVFGFEVVFDESEVDPGFFGDLAEGRVADALGREEGFGGVEEAGFGVVWSVRGHGVRVLNDRLTAEGGWWMQGRQVEKAYWWEAKEGGGWGSMEWERRA